MMSVAQLLTSLQLAILPNEVKVKKLVAVHPFLWIFL